MAGYGYYSGVGSSPYYVGQDADQAGQTAGVQPSAPAAEGYGMPSQAQSSPGAYGAASYASMMPQWMQDYFDANLTGQGFASLDKQRGLLQERLPQLQQQYGMNAAMNPYFAGQNVGKGYDPFNSNLYTTESMEENPELQKYISTQRNPFSGAALGQETYYQQKEAGGPDTSYQPMFAWDKSGTKYGGQDAKRDMLTGGMYSLNTRGVPSAAKAFKKLW